MRCFTKASTFSLLFIASSVASALEKPPSVLATIKPLQLISAAITDGVSETQLLLPANASPHDYQLRPSDMKKINGAEIILWVGPELESFLEKPLHQQKQGVVVQLGDALIGKKEKMPADDHDKHEHHDEHDDHHDDDHDKHEHHDEDHEDRESAHHGHQHSHDKDPHVWMDPKNAMYIAKELTSTLVNLDAKNAAIYEQNLTHFIKKLDKKDHEIQQRLAPLHGAGYFVFHDGYNHFEKHYGLNHLGAFTISPDRKPGAKHLQKIQQQIKEQHAVCVFQEPQFKPSIIHAVTQGVDIKVGTLDPLATEVKVSSDGYIEFLEHLASQFEQCLAS